MLGECLASGVLAAEEEVVVVVVNLAVLMMVVLVVQVACDSALTAVVVVVFVVVTRYCEGRVDEQVVRLPVVEVESLRRGTWMTIRSRVTGGEVVTEEEDLVTHDELMLSFSMPSFSSVEQKVAEVGKQGTRQGYGDVLWLCSDVKGAASRLRSAEVKVGRDGRQS